MTLGKLIEAVERGEFPGDVTARDLGRPDAQIAILTFYEAFSGSLDAAKALHDALLPGWDWRKPAVPWEKDSVAVQSPTWQPADEENDEGGYPWFKGVADDPARAWVIAVLRALEADP